MHHFVHVAVVESREELADDCGCSLLAEPLLLDDSSEERAPFYKLHHDVNELRVFEELKNFDDIRVVKVLQDVNFSNEAGSGRTVQRLFLYPLDGTLLFGFVVGAQENFTESAAAQRLAHLVVDVKGAVALSNEHLTTDLQIRHHSHVSCYWLLLGCDLGFHCVDVQC